MLVLARKKKEAIRIGDNIRVEVIEISGSRVRIGVTAPDDVEVHREEVYYRIQDERRREGK